jgi:hypothetical protein
MLSVRATTIFQFWITLATIAVMFVIIRHVPPLIPANSTTYAESLNVGITFLSSIGTYQSIARLLMLLFDHCPRLRKFVLGPSFVAGTWIGCYRNKAGEPRFTVEVFEQSLDRTTVRGWAFGSDKKLEADWVSDAVEVYPMSGLLRYSYNCQLYTLKTAHQGIAVFSFDRPTYKDPPKKMIGYSADLTDGDRTQNHEEKIADNGMALEAALERALLLA